MFNTDKSEITVSFESSLAIPGIHRIDPFHFNGMS